MKKGQITAFIIMGVLLLAMIGLLVYMLSVKETYKPNSSGALESSPVRIFVEECFEKTSVDSIYVISSQGGYYSVPEPYKNYLNRKIPFYYIFGHSNHPSIHTVEQELSAYVKAELPKCIKNFEEFKRKGYTIKERDIKPGVRIAEESVIFDMEYPVEIIRGESSTRIEDFLEIVEFDLRSVLETAGSIAEKQAEESNKMPLSFLLELAAEEGFSYEIVDFAEPNQLFNLVFEDQSLPEPLVFSFVIGYEWGDAG